MGPGQCVQRWGYGVRYGQVMPELSMGSWKREWWESLQMYSTCLSFFFSYGRVIPGSMDPQNRENTVDGCEKTAPVGRW